MVSLFATGFFPKKSDTFVEDYFTWKNCSKSMLALNEVKELTFVTNSVNGTSFYQRRSDGTVIENWAESKKLKNILLILY